MKFKTTLTSQEVDAFVYTCPYSHYMHTSEYANFCKQEYNCAVYYTGIYEKNKLIATAIILELHNAVIGHYMYIPAGMCMDYSNSDLLKQFCSELIQFAKEKGASSLKIDPNVLRMERDIYGNPIENGINNEYITEELKQLGFHHRGYNYAYDGSMRNRYTLIVDIDKPFEDVIKNMPKSKQNYFKRQNKMPIVVEEGGKELSDELATYAKELAEIQHFTPHNQAYFERLIDTYKTMGHTYICRINFKKLVAMYEDELKSGKYKKDAEAREHCEQDLEAAKQYMNQFGEIATLGVAFYVAFADKSYNLFNYINKELTKFRGTDAIHYHVIGDMQKRGITKYDLVGFSGVTEPTDLYYGLYDYKKSLGPEYIEHIGEFEYVVKPTIFQINNMYQRLRHTASRIKHKLLR